MFGVIVGVIVYGVFVFDLFVSMFKYFFARCVDVFDVEIIRSGVIDCDVSVFLVLVLVFLLEELVV